MAGESKPVLGWAQFAYTALIALVTAIITAVSSFYGLKESIRAETRTTVEEMRTAITEQRKNDLQQYLPLSTYWQWREDTLGRLSEMQRTLDRIEGRLRK